MAEKTSGFVFTNNFTNSMQPPVMAPAQSDTTLDKIGNAAGDVGNILTQVDKVLNPGKYQAAQPAQLTQQPQSHAGFGWTKWLLIAAVGGSALYAGKEYLSKKK